MMHATSIAHLLITIAASVASSTAAAAVSPNSAALIINKKLQRGRQDDASPPLQSAQLLDNDNVGYYFNMTPDYNRQSTMEQRLDTISILGINDEQEQQEEQQEEAINAADGHEEEEDQVVVEQRIPSQQQQQLRGRVRHSFMGAGTERRAKKIIPE